MSFIEQILIENEKILEEIPLDKYQFVIPVTNFLVGVFFFIYAFTKDSDLGLIAGFGLIIYGTYQYLLLKSTERAVTNFRVIEKKGLFTTEQNEIQFKSMETCEIKQNFIEKLLNIGVIVLTARGNSKLKLKNVEDPIKYLNSINTISLNHK